MSNSAMRYKAASLAALLLAAAAVSAATPQSRAPVKLTVSAAASLRDAFTEIDKLFARARPDIAIALNLGASGTLETQIEHGAPVDVFISASPQQMDQLAAKNLVATDTRVNLLTNEIVLIVPRDSKVVNGFNDLRRADVRVVAMGDPRSVPAGSYAQQTLASLGLADVVKGKTVFGTDVRQVLAAVETASADAGIVYATDAALSPRVRVVADAPTGSHEPIVYPIAVLRSSAHPQEARVFLQFLQSVESRAIFERLGFRLAGK